MSQILVLYLIKVLLFSGTLDILVFDQIMKDILFYYHFKTVR